MEIKIKPTSPLFKMPKKAFSTDACFDVYACSKHILPSGSIEYGLGFAAEIPMAYQLDVRARSSVHKHGLILSCGLGTGDEQYRGEYKMVFYHILKQLPEYEVGDRIGQIQITPVIPCHFQQVEKLTETDRGINGYGSTGK